MIEPQYLGVHSLQGQCPHQWYIQRISAQVLFSVPWSSGITVFGGRHALAFLKQNSKTVLDIQGWPICIAYLGEYMAPGWLMAVVLKLFTLYTKVLQVPPLSNVKIQYFNIAFNQWWLTPFNYKQFMQEAGLNTLVPVCSHNCSVSELFILAPLTFFPV